MADDEGNLCLHVENTFLHVKDMDREKTRLSRSKSDSSIGSSHTSKSTFSAPSSSLGCSEPMSTVSSGHMACSFGGSGRNRAAVQRSMSMRSGLRQESPGLAGGLSVNSRKHELYLRRRANLKHRQQLENVVDKILDRQGTKKGCDTSDSEEPSSDSGAVSQSLGNSSDSGQSSLADIPTRARPWATDSEASSVDIPSRARQLSASSRSSSPQSSVSDTSSRVRQEFMSAPPTSTSTSSRSRPITLQKRLLFRNASAQPQGIRAGPNSTDRLQRLEQRARRFEQADRKSEDEDHSESQTDSEDPTSDEPGLAPYSGGYPSSSSHTPLTVGLVTKQESVPSQGTPPPQSAATFTSTMARQELAPSAAYSGGSSSLASQSSYAGMTTMARQCSGGNSSLPSQSSCAGITTMGRQYSGGNSSLASQSSVAGVPTMARQEMVASRFSSQSSAPSSAADILDEDGVPVRQESVRQNSIVDAAHANRTCKPCMFRNSRAGCRDGPGCKFCHLEHSRSDCPRPSKGKRDRMRKKVVGGARQVTPQADTSVSRPVTPQ